VTNIPSIFFTSERDDKMELGHALIAFIIVVVVTGFIDNM